MLYEGIEDELLGEAIKATIVVNKNSKETINEEFIKQHCGRHLALHKIPSVYDIKDQITISATGRK
ncbi:MAG: hypothetical protein U0X39_04495 [Bacteroidales bacterium]